MKKNILLLVSFMCLWAGNARAQCTPNPGTTSGLEPKAANVNCITQGTPFSQVYTFVVPASTVTPVAIPVDSMRIDSVVNLPAGLTWAPGVTPPLYLGGSSGCFTVSGTTNAPCGQYVMYIYATIYTGFGVVSEEMTVLAGSSGISGFEQEHLRVIAPGDACPAVNASPGAAYTAYPVCGSAPVPPSVVTTAANNVTTAGATINGTIVANNLTTTGGFQWGLTTAYGNSAATTPATVTGTAVTPVSAAISGLSPNTTYHYRVFGNSTAGTSYGNDYTFTTPSGSGGPCIPNGSTTAGMEPKAANVNCITQGTYFSQVYTFVVPLTATGIPVNSLSIDSVVNLPAGLSWAPNINPAVYAGGASGCFEVSGTTNAPCGQYSMLVYVTATTAFGSFSNEMTILTANFGVTGFESQYLRVISSGNNCPAVNTTPTGIFEAYATCGVVTPLSINTSHTNVNCFGQNTGSATVVPTGGNGSYTYLWSNGATTATANNLVAGNYNVTVTSGAQTATASFSITQPASALTASATATATSCSVSTGTATATATGGTGSYTYWWSNLFNTATISNLSAGTYDVTVTDANSCTATATTTVTSPSSLAVSVAPTAVTCNGVNNGSVAATATGGTGNVTYSWSMGATISSVSNLPAGNYRVTVTDGAGCTASAAGAVTEPAALQLAIAYYSSTGSGAAAAVAVTGGTSPYTYLWSNGQTTDSISGLAQGIYSVTVTDANNCTASASAGEVVGLTDVNGSSAVLRLHPNPAGNVLNVEVSLPTGHGTRLAITDATGRVVYETHTALANHRAQIDVSQLPNGVYVLQVANPQGGVLRKQLVISK